MGFECTINTQNLNKIVGAILDKIEILNFFLMWTTLNFGSNSKTAHRDICKRTLDINREDIDFYMNLLPRDEDVPAQVTEGSNGNEHPHGT